MDLTYVLYELLIFQFLGRPKDINLFCSFFVVSEDFVQIKTA
jgi:hypothetical protein